MEETGIPEVGPLSDVESRRNFISNNIPEAMWESRSGASILDSLRDLGYGISTQDFYGIRRNVLRRMEVREEYRELSSDQLIPIDLMEERSDITMTMDAQYRLAMTVVDPNTGKREIVFRSIADDVHYTPREIENQAKGLFSMGGEGYEFIIEDVSLREVWVRPGARLVR